jgi:hypothetical protein
MGVGGLYGHWLGDGDRDIIAHVGEGLAREVRGPQVPFELAIITIPIVVDRVKVEWLWERARVVYRGS